ncbi:hypothetical protein Peur_073963 [Populus x canadensis]
MLRASHIPPVATPALSALKISLIPALSLSSSLPHLYKLSTFAPLHNFLPKTAPPNSSPISFKRFLPMLGHHPCPKASFSSGSGTGGGRELLVQHLLVKEDDLKLLLELQQRISGGGEDLSDLAVEYSLCPSKEEGGMLGWVRKGQMVPEFEEAAFSAPLNKVVRCKTKFGWHLLQVISEREESLLGEIQADELHVKIQDPTFAKEAQLIDVREPDEVKIWLRGREAALTISPCWVHDNMCVLRFFGPKLHCQVLKYFPSASLEAGDRKLQPSLILKRILMLCVTMGCGHYRLLSGCSLRVSREYLMCPGAYMHTLSGSIHQFLRTDKPIFVN